MKAKNLVRMYVPNPRADFKSYFYNPEVTRNGFQKYLEAQFLNKEKALPNGEA